LRLVRLAYRKFGSRMGCCDDCSDDDRRGVFGKRRLLVSEGTNHFTYSLVWETAGPFGAVACAPPSS
jgi:hypothetical protein